MGPRRLHRKRWRNPILVFISGLLILGFLSYLQPGGHKCNHNHRRSTDDILPEVLLHNDLFHSSGRHLLMEDDDPAGASKNNTTTPVKKPPQFPTDLFSLEQRRHGAVMCHVMGMVYMFVALAIVCDEFFIPALDVITVKLDISEDVAGATFMAAGGSAPELFTSVIGVFISFDDVGIGTIVGSAVFNLLFVISMCAIFSKSVLQLTWWPLFRDVGFYSIILVVLMVFFRDNIIYWWEAFILLLGYVSYVTFMKFNERVEKMVKKLVNRNKVTRVGSTDHLMPHGSKRQEASTTEQRNLRCMQSVLQFNPEAEQSSKEAQEIIQEIVAGGGGDIESPLAKRRMSAPILHAGSKFRHGLLQLLIHSIDPLHEGKLDEKASQLHTIASLRVLLDATKPAGTMPNGTIREHNCPACAPNPGTPCPRGGVQSSATHSLCELHSNVTSAETRITSTSEPCDITRVDSISNLQSETSINSNLSEKVAGGGVVLHPKSNAVAPIQDSIESGSSVNGANNVPDSGYNSAIVAQSLNNQGAQSPDEENEPLSVAWPDTCRKRLNYVLLAPIIFPLWLTMPDVRRPEKEKYVVGSFLGSIIWIALFSYLMVWWATLVGDTLGIPNEIMGLTFLAAGTSIPDLITSVLVARKGFGDMAVSSSVGSNIFDVAVGLPLPWLLHCIVYGPVKVSSQGMACSIFILFMMLLFVIITIAIFKWRMNIGLALVMFLLYFVFIACSLMLEYNVVSCVNIIKAVTGSN